MKTSYRSTWIFLLLILVGIVVGGILGEVLGQELSFLNKGYQIGLKPPFTLDLNVMQLTFGFLIDVNVASVLGILIAILIFRKM
ncbi:DUF4321 domain-containing protein [Clostridium sp. D2Q-11]|uniref:DUF4321 domain-containing protein n=1 Tax=Anaeromonas frigoriresistens TaxID=2683708 RepID=A0A942UVH4_9FIRM|nr:DUF4321 domain-containing protein [Anaeromonas frigoriresistens]MBS4537181.1 DUF4321 domain-containing protein [Anaeromonas frigoriresistens]